jgi:Flp pilus assembly protein TadD
LAIVTLAVYAQAVGHGFVSYDDPEYVAGNPYVRAGLTRAGLFWALTTGHAGNWHPLTWLSHMLDCQLYGLRPGAHHLTSVLLHTANALLLFVLLRGMSGALWPSAAVAAFFALHPLHVESVAWVAERKDVLSTLFWMFTLLAYGRYARRPSLRRYLLVLILLALGLMAKPMLVTLPLVMLLLDVWPLGRLPLASPEGATAPDAEYSARRQDVRGGGDPRTRRARGSNRPPRPGARRAAWQPLLRLVLEKVPFVALAAASSVVTFAVQLHGAAVAPVDTLPFKVRVANALVSYAAYLGKMIYPAGLVIFYPRVPLPAWQVAAAGLALVGGCLLVIWLARRQPWVMVGWLWYLVTLLPVLGLVQVGDQAMADRYTYVPLIGPFVMVAWSAAEIARRWPAWRAVLAASGGVLLAGCAAATALQLRYWRSSMTLFEHAVEVIPDNYVAHFSLGNALAEQGRLDEALVHYYAALRVKPDLAKAHGNVGVILARQGKLAEAVAHYAEALRLNPDLPEAHNNLGAALADQGRIEEAIAHYERALRLRPDYADAHTNLGMALAAQGKIDLAIAHYSEALRLDPGHPGARYNLERALAARRTTAAGTGSGPLSLPR